MPEAEVVAAALAIIFVAAVSQSVTGFGFALIMVPALSLAWDVKSTIVASTILSTVNLIPLALAARANVRVRRLLPMLAGSFSGVPLGLWVFASLRSDALQIVVGAVVIAGSLLLYFAPAVRPPSPDRVAPVVTGFTAGILRGATSMAGPPASLYLISTEQQPAVFRATMVWFLLPQGLFTIGGLLIGGRVTAEIALLSLACLPVMAVGITAGQLILPRVNDRLFRSLALGLLILTAALAILNAVA
jgi:uncharacterized membrane protein YfcA